ncbi:MAG: hypothetical protein FWD77_03330 [Betaproteobacteria bacterium]|nr:hypothetical protein [Betaproteobacteria bacterium]
MKNIDIGRTNETLAQTKKQVWKAAHNIALEYIVWAVKIGILLMIHVKPSDEEHCILIAIPKNPQAFSTSSCHTRVSFKAPGFFGIATGSLHSRTLTPEIFPVVIQAA